MMTIRKSKDRGQADHGWLLTKHTFSFADYYDPKHLGFRALRVINEDHVAPKAGFPTHPHRDMEIITYIVDGALEHKDSMGNTSVIRPGEVQHMTAGTGVQHSEYNGMSDKTTHLLQIWLTPDKENYPPGYGQRSFAQEFAKNSLTLVASRHGRSDSLTINQDVDIYIVKSALPGEKMFQAQFDYQWVQVIKGEVKIADQALYAGDGAALSNVHAFDMHWSKDSELIIFDLL